jgi:hypothetical protein
MEVSAIFELIGTIDAFDSVAGPPQSCFVCFHLPVCAGMKADLCRRRLVIFFLSLAFAGLTDTEISIKAGL